MDGLEHYVKNVNKKKKNKGDKKELSWQLEEKEK